MRLRWIAAALLLAFASSARADSSALTVITQQPTGCQEYALCTGQQGTGPCADFGVFTFVDGDVVEADDTIEEVGHGFDTGDGPVYLTNNGGALPVNLAAGTPYWVIRDSADLIRLATSKANALAGTDVNIGAAAGGGTHRLSGDEIVANLSGYQSATFYASGTASAFVCNVVENADGYDAASGVGQQVNLGALTETSRALVLEMPHLQTWVNCSTVTTGTIVVRATACP